MTTVINGTSTSASAPAVVGDDSNSGVYFPTSDQVAIATNGTQAVLVDSSQNVGIGATPTVRLEVAGAPSVAAMIVKAGTNGSGGIIWRNATNTSVGYTQINSDNVEYRSTNDGSGAYLQKAGITFPATQFASANANTLDDYEEGTWTPTIRGEAVNGTPVSGTGYYTKIGRFVYVSIRFESVARPGGGASGNAIVDVPFTFDTSLSSYSYPGVGLMVLFSGASIANTYQSVRVNEGTPYFRIQYQSNLNTDYTNLVVSDLGPSSNYIRFSFGYFVS